VAFAILCLLIVAIGRWTERHSPAHGLLADKL